MSNAENLFEKLRQRKTESVTPPAASKEDDSDSKSNTISTPAQQKKRGRPATGKRSDDSWIGRTYYVQRETDLDVEEELLQLKRQGIELDKSELVNCLLNAWVKWRKGGNSENLLSEISPRRKSK